MFCNRYITIQTCLIFFFELPRPLLTINVRPASVVADMSDEIHSKSIKNFFSLFKKWNRINILWINNYNYICLKLDIAKNFNFKLIKLPRKDPEVKLRNVSF